MALVFSVPRKLAQEARLDLDEQGLVDRKRKIGEEGGRVLIPLLSTLAKDVLKTLLTKYDGQLVDIELAHRNIPLTPFELIKNRIAQLAPTVSADDLPNKWERLGDAICLRLPANVTCKREVGQAYGEVLGAKVVVDYGLIGGVYRQPETKVVWGDEKATITTHLENGIHYRLDVLNLMFSSGNVDERIRMSTIPMKGEEVVDMFAGIGYFTLPMAVYAKPLKIRAYELNPLSHRYLQENIELNGVSNIVEAYNQDNRTCPEGVADRILMGYVGTTHEFLPKAMQILKDEGGWVHYHETCPDELITKRPSQRLTDAAKERGWKLIDNNVHVIKSYAPGISHLVVDALLG